VPTDSIRSVANGRRLKTASLRPAIPRTQSVSFPEDGSDLVHHDPCRNRQQRNGNHPGKRAEEQRNGDRTDNANAEGSQPRPPLKSTKRILHTAAHLQPIHWIPESPQIINPEGIGGVARASRSIPRQSAAVDLTVLKGTRSGAPSAYLFLTSQK